MSEIGCLRDGHFNNLQVDGKLISGSTITDIDSLIRNELQRSFDGSGGNLVGSSINLGTDLSGTQHTVNSADGAINFFNWTSGVQLFSFNIGEQITTLGIPQRSVHGYDIAGDQSGGSGKSYIMSLKDSGTDVSSLTIPRNVPWRVYDFSDIFNVSEEARSGFEVTFVVEFPDISGVSLAMFGVRDTIDNFSSSKSLSNVRNDYENFIAFAIENDSGDNTKGNLTLSQESVSNSNISPSIDITQPRGGKISDNEVWEFKISVSQQAFGEVDATCTAMCLNSGGRPTVISSSTGTLFSLGDRKTNMPADLEPGIPYSPFIHCIQSSDVTPIILHSLIYDRRQSIGEGGH